VSLFNAYMNLSGATDAEVLRNERLSQRTTYHIGGPAGLFVTVNSYSALVKVLSVLAAERIDWVVLGKGSNILASDRGYDGCVIVLGGEFSHVSVGEGGLVTAGAGVVLGRLVNEALKNSLSGLECCVGIPGTVGGAVSMDAGSRHEWIGRVVRDLVVLRPGEGMHRYEGSEVDWGYRHTSLGSSEIILEVTFELEPGEKGAIGRDMDQRLRRRRQSQPAGKATCGSVFRNPGDRSVGMLIESCGLKGFSVGGAQVSDVHSNFVINKGGASATDVVAVMNHVHDVVLARHGIDLQPEVKLLGFSR